MLVTGSSGLIGGILADRLADRYVLRGFDLTPGRIPGTGDVRDLDAVREACRGARAIVHLAGYAHEDAPWPGLLDVNIAGTYTVFEAARQEGVERVVFASSNHVVGMHEIERAPGIYAPGKDRAIQVRDEIRPDSLYAVSKAFGEALGRYYSDRHGLRVVCLRIGSVLAEEDPWHATSQLRTKDPERLPRYQSTWLSHRDCAELIATALEADVRWAVVYGVSDNPRRFWDLEPAERLLGFRPRDRAPVNLPDAPERSEVARRPRGSG